MSIEALSWALKQRVTRSSDKFVLVCMANYANDQGLCYPSVQTLSSDTSMDRKTIMVAIRRLIENGFIVHAGNTRNRVAVYRVNMVNEFNQSTKIGTQNWDPKLVPNPVAFGQQSTVFPHDRYQKRYIEPKRTKEDKKVDAPLTLHETLPRDAWEEWIAHRREKRWPVTGRALSAQLKILSEFDTETQREMLETSIQAGWQGVFRPRGAKKAKTENQPKGFEGVKWM
jgi:hypothetical protein